MPTRVTEGYLARHYYGRANMRDAALLDIAQDHALHILHDAELFDSGLVFKGGTALRKFRAGHQGRFSTDLDFAAAEAGVAELLFEVLDGAQLDDFRFSIREREGNVRANLHVETPFGPIRIGSRIDVSLRRPWLPAVRVTPIALPIHGRYSFVPAPTPIIRIEDLLSEKLARFRRVQLARDLYDLYWISDKSFDEALVKRLTVMKVWWDVAMEGRGVRPFDPTEILLQRRPGQFQAEPIGLLIVPVDVPRWLERVRRRYVFIVVADEVETRLAACSLVSEREMMRCINELAGYESDLTPPRGRASSASGVGRWEEGSPDDRRC